MKIKDLFFPNPEQKVTDKYLRRTLLVSICGILLCMSCLVGTTWAWFTVSVENTGNVITVATKPKVLVSINGDSVKTLQPNLDNSVRVEHASEPDDVQKKSTLYVTFSLNEVVQGYVILNQENGYSATINITTNQERVLSWTASWFKPEGTEQIVDYTIDLTVQDAPEESTEETTTDSTEETPKPTETTDSTEETTTPTETTTDSTEETTKPTETTDSTEEPKKPTEETTQTTENEATQETTQTTENETTQETTQTESQETDTDTAEPENSSAEDQV